MDIHVHVCKKGVTSFHISESESECIYCLSKIGTWTWQVVSSVLQMRHGQPQLLRIYMYINVENKTPGIVNYKAVHILTFLWV